MPSEGSAPQTVLDHLEILVMRVRYLHRPQFRCCCEAQLEIVREARADAVAFIEDHCYAEPRWAEEILKVIGEPGVGAVNYTFTRARDVTYLGRSILMAEHGHCMAPHPGGKVTIASSTNLAYPRALTLAYLAATPLSVAMMLARAARYARASGHLGMLARCWPVVAFGYVACAWGKPAPIGDR